jgi:hypothetical protein
VPDLRQPHNPRQPNDQGENQDEHPGHAGRPSEADRSGADTRRRVADAALFADIDRHLLKALLTPDQSHSVDARGWFDLSWEAQWLVLRVYTDGQARVDAFQAPPRRAAGSAGAGEAAGHYLCSWDVGAIARRAAGDLGLPIPAGSSVGCARAVVAAHRQGRLRPLLEAAEEALRGEAYGVRDDDRPAVARD